MSCCARGSREGWLCRLLEALTSMRVDGGGAKLSFSPQWAEEHPRTAYLLREEPDLWARQGALLITLG